MVSTYKYKYFEKNIKESHTFIFKNLEIKQYFQKILKNQGLNLHSHKLNFSESTLNLFMSIYETEQASIILKKKQSNTRKKINILKKKLIVLQKIIKKYYIKKQIKNIKLNKVKISKLYTICLKKLYLLSKHSIKYIDKSNKISNEQLLENLSLFTNYKFNLSLKVKQINSITLINDPVKKLNNKNAASNKQTKQILMKLKKFERNLFFKEGRHVFIASITQHNTANLLSNFISKQLRTLKRQNFFFSFLKESLSTIITLKFSKIKGIKILIKGRLNNAARSKNIIISLGKISLITAKTKIDYAESTAFTSNGTLGVKVWVCN